MPYLNKATIMGHLGRDAEQRAAGQKIITQMSIAIADGTKDKPHTTWIRVEAWDLPEFITKGLTKGALVLVDGRLRFEEWDDKDGQKKSMTKLVADSYGVKTFEKKADEGIVSQPRGAAKQASPFDYPAGGIDDDDVPF
jgi:single-strand DNA-binding protein